MNQSWEELFESPSAAGWGSGASRVTFGLGSVVLADLAAGLNAHSKAVRRPVVLGCVPWFSDDDVAAALCSQEAICIVVDKGGIGYDDKNPDPDRDQVNAAVRRACDQGGAILSTYLPGLDTIAPRIDGSPAIVGPRDFPLEEYWLGPVRVGGHFAGEFKPLLHAKVAVCCDAWIGEGEFGQECSGLSAVRAWIGSANWSKVSARHTEVGVWIDDRELAEVSLDFVAGLILKSEPLGSRAQRPRPEFARADLDDDAFADYAAQFDLDDPDLRFDL